MFKNNFLLVLLPLVSQATKYVLYGDYWVDVTLDENDINRAKFVVRMTTSSWFGLVIGEPDMAVGADFIQIDGAN